MMMDSIKMIVIDVDSTLMTDESVIPSEAYHVIDYLLNSDIKVVIASGRQLNNLYSLFKPYDDKLIFIAQNGSIISEGHIILYTNKISPEKIKQCVSFGRDNDASILLYSQNNILVVNPIPDVLVKLKSFDVPFIISDKDSLNYNEVTKVSFFKIGGEMASLQSKIKIKGINAFISYKYMLDITNSNTNKGTALKKIKALYKVPRNKICAFGDSENDIDMFKEAYYSYAMSNASDIVKQYALRIAPSNNDMGVISVLKHLFLIE